VQHKPRNVDDIQEWIQTNIVATMNDGTIGTGAIIHGIRKNQFLYFAYSKNNSIISIYGKYSHDCLKASKKRISRQKFGILFSKQIETLFSEKVKKSRNSQGVIYKGLRFIEKQAHSF
jgi:hypothetical protein